MNPLTVKTTSDVATLDVARCRSKFPSLDKEINGHPVAYFDGPAGSQVPLSVARAVQHCMLETNANIGEPNAVSRSCSEMLQEARRALVDLFGCDDPRGIVFGQNMTSLTFAFSRALAQTWQPGDEIIVTQLEHDANVTPWVLAARDRDVKVQEVAVRLDDCTLDMDDFHRKLSDRTRLVAIGCASNSVGTTNPFVEFVEAAHAHGAQVFLDAVHWVPHHVTDVAAWGCDYLACSAYKFFAPHVGVLWGRPELLEAIEAYKVRPAPTTTPAKWMTGTQNHEGIAGVLAAVEYLADVGAAHIAGSATGEETVVKADGKDDGAAQRGTRRENLLTAYAAMHRHEMQLTEQLLVGLKSLSHFRVLGIDDPRRLDERVPTVSFVHDRLSPAELAEYLGDRGILTFHGNMYALRLCERLGLEPGGMLRIGILHYNTTAEIDRLLALLAELD